MKDSDQPKCIEEFFSGSETFTMPLYQRKYCWGIEQLELFGESIGEIFEAATNKSSVREYFLGATILQKKGVGLGKYEFNVVDGQQRLTSIFLMLLAIAEYARDKGWIDYAESIRNDYLVHRRGKKKGSLKLIPTNYDRRQFNKIIEDSEIDGINLIPNPLGNESGAMADAYKIIKNNLVRQTFEEYGESEDDFELFTESFLTNFVVADITIDENKHDANEVFHMLNTAGMALGITDIIRNNLFMNVDPVKAEKFYNNQWSPFESKLGKEFPDIQPDRGRQRTQTQIDKILSNQLGGFFYPYATIQDETFKKNGLANDLNDYWKKKNFSETKIIKDLTQYINPYLTWADGYFDVKKRIDSKYSPELRSAIISLKQMGVNKAMLHFLVRLLHEVNQGNINHKKAANNIKLIESHFVRRALETGDTAAAGTGMDAIFKGLWKKTNGDLNKMRNVFADANKRIPNDPDFKLGICENPIYRRGRLTHFLLLKYEEYLKAQAWEVYPNQHISTADHINPQKHGLKGKNKDEYEETLHLWGNLLPMSRRLNSSKGCRKVNKKLKDELDKKANFETTKEWLNELNTNSKDTWQPQDIKDRTKKIADWAVNEWKG